MHRTIAAKIEEPVLGEAFGPFRPVAELGSGGMANVLLALDLRVERRCGERRPLTVLKVMRREFACDPDALAMFLDEASLSIRLRETHIVETYEILEIGGRHVLVMEHLDGQPLNRVAPRVRADDADGRQMPLALHLRVLSEVLVGLHSAHELKDERGESCRLVHRDVSPHNVFVTYEGRVKVLDFGIAKSASSSVETKTGMFKGKIRYIAPEQFMGERVDRRADVYAVGVMLWEALTGRSPWAGRTDIDVMRALLDGTSIPAPRSVVETIPESLDRLCARALAWAPDARIDSCALFRAELEAALVELGYAGVGPPDVAAYVCDAFGASRERWKRLVEAEIEEAERAVGEEEAWAASHSMDVDVELGGLSSASPSTLPSIQLARRPHEASPRVEVGSDSLSEPGLALPVRPARTWVSFLVAGAALAAIVGAGSFAALKRSGVSYASSTDVADARRGAEARAGLVEGEGDQAASAPEDGERGGRLEPSVPRVGATAFASWSAPRVPVRAPAPSEPAPAARALSSKDSRARAPHEEHETVGPPGGGDAVPDPAVPAHASEAPRPTESSPAIAPPVVATAAPLPLVPEPPPAPLVAFNPETAAVSIASVEADRVAPRAVGDALRHVDFRGCYVKALRERGAGGAGAPGPSMLTLDIDDLRVSAATLRGPGAVGGVPSCVQQAIVGAKILAADSCGATARVTLTFSER